MLTKITYKNKSTNEIKALLVESDSILSIQEARLSLINLYAQNATNFSVVEVNEITDTDDTDDEKRDYWEEQRKLESLANKITIVDKNMGKRFVDGFLAVYVDNGVLVKEKYKTLFDAKMATLKGVPKRVEVLYSMFRVSCQLPNGTTLIKDFKREKKAKTFITSLIAENVKVTRLS